MRRPYVGVCGYASVEQARRVHHDVRPLLGRRILADGYLVWLPFLIPRWGGPEPVHPTFLSRSLRRDAAVAAFTAPGHGSLRIAHVGTSTYTRLDEQLQDCSELLGEGVDGVQINVVPRPSAQELAHFRRHQDERRARCGRPALIVVLQLHRAVLDSAGTPDDLVRHVEPYVDSGAVTHVLYDPSEGGLGSAFHPERAVQAVTRLRSEFPDLSCGVAGGLSPENVGDRVARLWAADPSLNIDVESGVRNSATDTLDVARAAAYARAALTLGGEFDNPAH